MPFINVSSDDKKRIFDTVRRSENAIGGNGYGPSATRGVTTIYTLYVKVGASDIAPETSATVTVYGSGGSLDREVTAYNAHTTYSIPANSYGFVNIVNGGWWFTSIMCS